MFLKRRRRRSRRCCHAHYTYIILYILLGRFVEKKQNTYTERARIRLLHARACVGQVFFVCIGTVYI